MRRDVQVARAQGTFNVVSGVWPLLHLRSFEWVFGPKVDRWLVNTVAGLLIANGCTQLLASGSEQQVENARRNGVGTATTLLAIDVVYVAKGRIRWTYLLDAAAEIGWLIAWKHSGSR